MRFCLIDRITELVPGESITAIKNLTMAEEYLADHFPRFPIMPGVLMLQAMTEAASWLVRVTDDFAYSLVLLSAANNIKYGQFVEPGQTMTVQAEIMNHQPGGETKLKVQGQVDGRLTARGRIVLTSSNLADTNPIHRPADEGNLTFLRKIYSLIDRVDAAS